MSQTITRLFDNYSDAASAVRDLEAIGISHDDLSIVASNADQAHDAEGDVTRGVTAGAVLGGGAGLLAGLGLLAIPGLGPIVAAGWLAATAAGVGVGAAGGAATGSIVGALKNAGHTEDDAHVYSEGVRRGGTLVSAKVADAQVDEAKLVLNRYHAVDAASRGEAYRNTGWTKFDDAAPVYTPEQVREERQRYIGERAL
jgi:hypothetical protein